MESSRVLDAPQHALQPESEKRLARIFCFLRQHERKSKVARKVAELQKLRCSSDGASSDSAARSSRPDSEQPVAGSDDESGDAEGAEEEQKALDGVLFDQSSLLDELNLLRHDNQKTSSKAPSGAKRPVSCGSGAAANATPGEKAKQHTHALELGREIRELQKGVLPASTAISSAEIPGCITAADILSAMKVMNRSATKAEVQWMIWEADDDLDGCVDWHEFRSCYVRSLADKHGLEPNQLYHLIQFLLCDTDESCTVSVLELKAELKKLPGTDHLATKLLVALKDDAEQQLLQKFTLGEYLEIMLADLPASFAVASVGGK